MGHHHHASIFRVLLYWSCLFVTILLLVHRVESLSLPSPSSNNKVVGGGKPKPQLADHTDLTTLREDGYDKLVDACFQNDVVGNTVLSDLRAMTFTDFVSTFSQVGSNHPALKAKLIGWIHYYQLRDEFYVDEDKEQSYEERMDEELSRLQELNQYVDQIDTLKRRPAQWRTFPFQKSSGSYISNLEDPIDTPYVSATEFADDPLPPSLDKELAQMAESMREEKEASSLSTSIDEIDVENSTAATITTTEIPMNTPARQSLPDHLELRAIPGKGLGVITKNAIAANTVIGDYKGEVLTLEEKDRRYVDAHLQTAEDKEWIAARQSSDQTLTGDYLYRVVIPGATKEDATSAIYVDAEDEYKSNWARFFNHDVPPNIHPKSIHESWDGNPRVWFVSDRDIEAGEELCFDYGDDYWLPGDIVA